MKLLGLLTHYVKNFFTPDEFFPRVLVYPNTFIQEKHAYIIIAKLRQCLFIDVKGYNVIASCVIC